MSRADSFDIVVVGAGLAGACAAALLARQAGLSPERIGLIAETDAGDPGAVSGAAAGGAAPPELRVVALSRASQRVLAAAQAWDRLDEARLCAYERVCVWHETAPARGSAALCFDAAEIGEPDLGHIAESGALARACAASFLEAGGRVLSGSVSTLHVDGAVNLECRDGRRIRTRLLVGADGARSLVREQLCSGARVRDYRQIAIVANVTSERPHERTAWQRFLSTGPLALLPLFDGSSSIVWSLQQELGERLMAAAPEEFGRRLTEASDAVLGALSLVGARASFPLRSLAARAYVAPHCALIGDAAHVIHPLAGQGANLGLLDAAALCEAVAWAVAQREEPGALRALRRYEQSRRTHNLLVDAAMSAFQRGFGDARGPAAWLINRGLALVDHTAPLKRAFARAALGVSGELPSLAR